METNLLWDKDQKQLCFQVKQQLQTDDHWTLNLNSILNADNAGFKYNSTFKKFVVNKTDISRKNNDKQLQKEQFKLGLGAKIRNFEEYKSVNRDQLLLEASVKRAFQTSTKYGNTKFISGLELGGEFGFNIKLKKYEGHGYSRITQKILDINDMQDVKFSIGGDLCQNQGEDYKTDLFFQIRENNWGLTYRQKRWFVSYDL